MVHIDESIVGLITAYAAARGISPSYSSFVLTGNGDTLRRLERGTSLTSRRAARIVQTASDHWPADPDWPEEIVKRPDPSPDSPAAQAAAEAAAPPPETPSSLNELAAPEGEPAPAPPGMIAVPTRAAVRHALFEHVDGISGWARRRGYPPHAVHVVLTTWGGRTFDPARCRSARTRAIVQDLVRAVAGIRAGTGALLATAQELGLFAAEPIGSGARTNPIGSPAGAESGQ